MYFRLWHIQYDVYLAEINFCEIHKILPVDRVFMLNYSILYYERSKYVYQPIKTHDLTDVHKYKFNKNIGSRMYIIFQSDLDLL